MECSVLWPLSALHPFRLQASGGVFSHLLSLWNALSTVTLWHKQLTVSPSVTPSRSSIYNKQVLNTKLISTKGVKC